MSACLHVDLLRPFVRLSNQAPSHRSHPPPPTAARRPMVEPYAKASRPSCSKMTGRTCFSLPDSQTNG
ncbi:hypothetical protein B0O80DRAFT_459190 [Mortierella sp. GBAus27b]|nr:hypothetical protein B0O80DRAFT_459190 [Mortierella sp. GBAus27b]